MPDVEIYYNKETKELCVLPFQRALRMDKHLDWLAEVRSGTSDVYLSKRCRAEALLTIPQALLLVAAHKGSQR